MNNFAISSGGIGEALERSASSLMAANNTIDESIALITAANTVVQDPAQVGTAFKTISMRIRGAKTELEEAGLETEGMVESTAKLREEILALSGVDIMENANEFKSTYKIMDELAAKWENLTDIQQATVTELIAGKRQGNIVSSLMSNFDTAREALETSLNSSGSAMAEHAKWSESLDARLLKLKATWQSLSQSFMSSDFLKGVLDSVIGLVNGIDKLIDSVGTLGTIGLGVGIFEMFKHKSGISFIFKELSTFGSLASEVWKSGGKIINRFKDIGAAASVAGRDIGGKLLGSLSGTVGAIGLVVAAVGLAYNAYKKAKEAASEARQEVIESSNEYLDAASSFEQAYIKYSGRTDLTAEEEAELESAINGTVDALKDKSSALHGVVNSSNDYITSLEAITDAELKAAEKVAQEKQKNAKLELEDVVKDWHTNNTTRFQIKNDSTALKIAQEMDTDFLQKETKGKKGHHVSTYWFDIPSDADADKILDYYYTLVEYKNKLLEVDDFDTNKEVQSAYEDVNASIEKLSGTVKVYEDGLYDLAKAEYQARNGIPKTTEAYLEMREAILTRGDIARTGLDTRMSILNSLDSEYANIFDLSSAEAQARKFVGIIKGYGDGTKDGTDEIGTVETFLNMRTAVNNNECTVGQYLSELSSITSMSEQFSEDEKKEFNLAFGLDTDSIKERYEDAYNYIYRNYIKNLDTTGLRVWEFDQYKTQEIERVKSLLNGLTATELQAVANIKAEIDWSNTSTDDILKQIKEEAKLIEALNFEANIEIDTTALELLNTALAESASAMGLSKEAIDSLKSKYADLDSYNPSTLFERTANGVKVNRDELAKLEKECRNLNNNEVQEHLDALVGRYNELSGEIDKCSNASERAELISERETYADKIEELATYQAQLEGVTGAYQRWIDAQNTPEDYEGYQAVATSREDIQDEIDRGFISNATKEYIDLLSGEDLVGGTIDDYAEAWDKLDKKVGSTSYSIHDFFTVNDDGDITSTGIDRFFEGLRQDFEGEVANYNEKSGKWTYDFSQENLKKIQDEWGIGIEAIELLLEAAASAGYDIDWGGILENIDLDTSSFETLVSTAEAAQAALNEINGFEDINFNFTATGVEEAESEIERARQVFSQFINSDGTVNLEADGAEEMQFILTTLIIQKQQLSTPAIMKVDTSQIDQAETDIIDVINKAKELQTAYENYEIAISTGVDVEGAKSDLNSAIEGMQGTSVDVRADLKLPTNEELEAAKGSMGDIKVGATLDGTSIGNLATQIQTQCTPEVIAKVTGIDETAITNGEGGRQVKYTPEHSEVDAYINSLTDINKKIIFKYTTEGSKPNPSNIERTITYKYETEGESPAAGTAHANGSTSGRAFARGNWGIKGSGTALGGELGQELIVRDGKFFTIGDTGAEFFRYKPNDIIFNAAQTESLFKFGGIKGAKPRGKMLASGSAFADGSYPSNGRAFSWKASAASSNFVKNRLNSAAKNNKPTTKTTTKKNSNSATTTTTTSWSAIGSDSDFANNRKPDTSGSGGSGGSGGSKDKEEFKEVIDWIPLAIDRIERAIDSLDTKANSVYRSWSERNESLINEIDKVVDEIELQQRAYDRYIQEANSVGLSEDWAKKVRDGKVDIETITDEELAEKIKDYQKW